MSDALAVLQRIRELGGRQRPRPGESCELCAEDIAEEHGHVVDLSGRSLLCACRACYLLFTGQGAGGGHYKAVPDRYLELVDFSLEAAKWEAIQIPVGVAFFLFNSTVGGVAAFYPGPAGATESLLSLDAWTDLVAAHRELESLEPDTEALLVRAEARHAVEGFIVPIDACYELVGMLRQVWRGFDGGSEAHHSIEQFFAKVRVKAR